MNDYFQHLIDKSTNQTPVIRPRFPSVFEASDVHAAPVIDDCAAEIVNRPRERTERTPAVHPELSLVREFLEFPDTRDSTAIADFNAETISHPPEKTGAGNEITVSAPPDVLSGKETPPEKIIRKNASKNHREDNQGMPGFSAHTQALRPFPGETVNPARRKTALKNVQSQPALPDLQPHAVDDAGTNTKPYPQHWAAEKVKKTPRRVLTTETGAREADFRETKILPAWFGKQPQIRPLTAAEGSPQISPTLPPQEMRPEKTIKVTIGRIEVRAIKPQTPAYRPQTAPKEPQPKISLEDYLKKQRGGSR